MTPKLSKIWHGGDYNPEQWNESTWLKDAKLMKQAGWNIATLGVFSWAALQINEETWDFAWLDRVFEILHQNEIQVCLATSTASVPAWLTEKYPDVLTVNSKGQRLRRGGRHIFCPNSPSFNRLSTQIAGKLAERYGDHPALAIWHVGNEYGGNDIGARCFCPLCESAFRVWLEDKYGDLNHLNQRWDTAFWGKTYRSWQQIEPPFEFGENSIQALKLDYDRFQDESLLGCFRAEAAILRAATPDIPVTTNMMGAFKPLDYHAWAKHVDIAAFDNYPAKGASFAHTAFNLALTRGLKEGQPWLLMEQTPSQQNWQAQNALKKPGVMRLWSYQAMAHGADSVMYFQWRRTRGGIEKFHGAVVEHAGTPDARVFREVAQIGAELQKLGMETLGGLSAAKVAVLFSWETWWAVENASGPSRDLKYHAQCQAYFAALHEAGIACDIVSPLADLSGYSVIVAPVFYMITEDLSEKLEAFVRGGGTLLTTFFSGIADECDSVHPGGYPGPLRSLLGICVEEVDALMPGDFNRAVFETTFGALNEAPCGLICERLHLEGAQALATFGDDFYAGEPVFTRHDFGSGAAYYLASALQPADLKSLLTEVCARAEISPLLSEIPAGLEVTMRVSPDGKALMYLLNHNSGEIEVKLPPGEFFELLSEKSASVSVRLPAYEVAILKQS